MEPDYLRTFRGCNNLQIHVNNQSVFVYYFTTLYKKIISSLAGVVRDDIYGLIMIILKVNFQYKFCLK